MNLMICDDQKNELEIMKQIVSEYAAAHLELSLAIKCFTNSFDINRSRKNSKYYSHLFRRIDYYFLFAILIDFIYF